MTRTLHMVPGGPQKRCDTLTPAEVDQLVTDQRRHFRGVYGQRLQSAELAVVLLTEQLGVAAGHAANLRLLPDRPGIDQDRSTRRLCEELLALAGLASQTVAALRHGEGG